MCSVSFSAAFGVRTLCWRRWADYWPKKASISFVCKSRASFWKKGETLACAHLGAAVHFQGQLKFYTNVFWHVAATKYLVSGTICCFVRVRSRLQAVCNRNGNLLRQLCAIKQGFWNILLHFANIIHFCVECVRGSEIRWSSDWSTVTGVLRRNMLQIETKEQTSPTHRSAQRPRAWSSHVIRTSRHTAHDQVICALGLKKYLFHVGYSRNTQNWHNILAR